jgi:hypothetical protein
LSIKKIKKRKKIGNLYHYSMEEKSPKQPENALAPGFRGSGGVHLSMAGMGSDKLQIPPLWDCGGQRAAARLAI